MLPSDHGRLYQPAITRLPSLLCLLLFTLSLIGLTELACRRLPSAKNDGITTTMGDKISPHLARRVLDSRNPAPNPQQDSETSAQGHTTIALDAETTDFLSLGSGPVTETAAPSAFLPISTDPVPAESTTIATPAPSPSKGAFLPISSTDPGPAESTVGLDASKAAFLPISSTDLGPAESTSIPVTLEASKSAFLPISSTDLGPAESTSIPVTLDASKSAFLPISSTDLGPAESTSIPVTLDASKGAFLPISSTDPVPAESTSIPPPALSPSQGAFLPISSTDLGPAESTSKPVLVTFTTGDASKDASLPISSTDASGGHAGAVPSSYFLPLTQGTATLASQQPSLLPFPNPSALNTAISTAASGTVFQTRTDTSGSFTLRTTAPPAQTGIFQGEAYSVGPNGVVVIDGTTFATGTPTTATLADNKVVVVWPSGSISVQDAKDRAPKPKTYLTPEEYVLGAFVPTLLAVLFSIPWHLLASAIKEMEPFYQLQRPDGVTAENSIALDYRASINIIATLNAMKKGHFLVWWSGLVSLVVLVIAPLSSETVFIGFDGKCTATSGREACSPSLSVYPVAARVLQGMLAFIAILTLALAVAILRGRSGVYANPLSIAGLSTLFQNPRAVESFGRLNPYCTTSKMIRNALQDYRYRIDAYLEDDGVSSYGLIISHQQPDVVQTNFRTSSHGGKKYATVAVNAVEEHVRPERQRTISSFFVHPAAIVTFALFVAGLETLVIYFHKTGGDTGFEKFMDSQSFGVGFLFTAVGVLVKMYWCLLDDEIRNMEPYRQLLAGGAKASDSILLAPHTNPFTGLFYSLRNGHIFNSYISLVAILCEPLIIALANIPFKAGLTFTAYQASTYVTIGILSMMLMGIIWMLCRKRTPELIRKPDTVASVLLFLCGSSMLEDFKGMALMNRKERDVIINRWDKRYAIGSVIGVDGVEREGIDESLFVGEPAR